MAFPDWPLSRDEKRTHIFGLYERDIQAANKAIQEQEDQFQLYEHDIHAANLAIQERDERLRFVNCALANREKDIRVANLALLERGERLNLANRALVTRQLDVHVANLAAQEREERLNIVGCGVAWMVAVALLAWLVAGWQGEGALRQDIELTLPNSEFPLALAAFPETDVHICSCFFVVLCVQNRNTSPL